MIHPNDHLRDLVGGGQVTAGLHEDLPVVLGEASGGEIRIDGLERARHLKRRKVVRRQSLAVQVNEDLSRVPSMHGGLGRVGHRLKPIHDLVRHSTKAVSGVRVAVEREGDDGHVVYLDGADEPARHAGGDGVNVGLDLVVDFDQAALAILADIEAHRDHRLAGARDGIHVFDAVYLP